MTQQPVAATPSADVTGALCAFVADLRPGDLPAIAVERASAAIADTVGCAIAGMRTASVAPLLALVTEEGGAKQASLFGTRLRVPATAAALVNGMAGHSLDFDDICGDMYGHPSVVLVPALFAVAEKVGASGSAVVCAYAAGLEVAAAIGRQVNPGHYDRGWHATATIGSFAAAAAVAHLLKLPGDRMRHALGIAAAQSAGMRRQFGSDVKPMHAGLAARAGVLGADLAARGMSSDRAILDGPGGYADLFGGDAAARAASAASASWKPGGELALVVGGLQVKRHACCAATHTSIDAVLDLVARHGIASSEIAAIECRVSPLAAEILKFPSPRTPLEGKFSLHFCVAVAAIAGDCGMEQFTQARVEDPRIRALASRVALHVDATMPASGTTPSRTSIVLNDGTRVDAMVARPKGSPEAPFTADELQRKFLACTAATLHPPDAASLFDRLVHISAVGDLSEITTSMRRSVEAAAPA